MIRTCIYLPNDMLTFIYFLLTSSVHVKYKIFLSAMEYLPFSSEDDSKGSFEEIIERYEFVKQNVFSCEEDKP